MRTADIDYLDIKGNRENSIKHEVQVERLSVLTVKWVVKRSFKKQKIYKQRFNEGKGVHSGVSWKSAIKIESILIDKALRQNHTQ